jgi:DNA-binding LacI/PurR family transcriptional regulator
VEIFKDLERRRFDGLIIASYFILESKDAQDTLEQVRKCGLPIVEMDENYGVDSVSSDYRDATREVMSYLLSLGHRRIGLVYGVGNHVLGQDRLQPYLESLTAANIPIEKDLFAECGPAIEDGYQASLTLLQLSPRPSALLVINDLLSIGALRAAADLGLRVPEDLSLVGFDDIPMANYLVPRLTTVTKNARAAGIKAFEVLMARIQNPVLPRQQVHIKARLILRESTGPAPSSVES